MHAECGVSWGGVTMLWGSQIHKLWISDKYIDINQLTRGLASWYVLCFKRRTPTLIQMTHGCVVLANVTPWVKNFHGHLKIRPKFYWNVMTSISGFFYTLPNKPLTKGSELQIALSSIGNPWQWLAKQAKGPDYLWKEGLQGWTDQSEASLQTCNRFLN